MIDQLSDALGVEAMLAPLAEPAPIGIDLRSDFGPTSLYFRLRDARAEARAEERSADAALNADAPIPLAWRQVQQLAVGALTKVTKDLELAAWLTEALVRSEGIAGLAVGAGLMQGLVRRFWDKGLYPVPDEDGLTRRVAPVTGLNGESGDGTLIQPLRKQIFFRRPDGTPVAFWEFDASLKLQGEADAKKRQLRIAAGVKPFEELERDARAVGGAAFATLRSELRNAHAAWMTLGTALDEAAGRDAPPIGRVTALLDDMLLAVARYAPREIAVSATDMTSLPQAPASATVAASLTFAGRAEMRDEMLQELGRIADYFRRTEPHSPIAYTLDHAVRRGRMSWPDLLAEIVPDPGARTQMLLQLGIKPESG